MASRTKNSRRQSSPPIVSYSTMRNFWRYSSHWLCLGWLKEKTRVFMFYKSLYIYRRW